MYQPITYHKRCRGSSLIEVLVAVLVLSIGLLGVAALQGNALKTNNSALQRSQAVALAYFILDAMRVNKSEAIAGNYDLGSIGATDTPVCSAPTVNSLATHDQSAWFAALKENLGNVDTTCGLIDCDATTCTVKVFWDDSRAGGEQAQVIAVSTKL
jgi:type IV pilus assembly protein PilV